jgi:hypothetical protein
VLFGGLERTFEIAEGIFYNLCAGNREAKGSNPAATRTVFIPGNRRFSSESLAELQQ